MPNYHVKKNREGRWAAKRAGADKAGGLFDTQREAEKAAKRFAANRGGGEVRIHDRKGRIRDSDTVPPGRDPNPPKDRRH